MYNLPGENSIITADIKIKTLYELNTFKQDKNREWYRANGIYQGVPQAPHGPVQEGPRSSLRELLVQDGPGQC